LSNVAPDGLPPCIDRVSDAALPAWGASDVSQQTLDCVAAVNGDGRRANGESFEEDVSACFASNRSGLSEERLACVSACSADASTTAPEAGRSCDEAFATGGPARRPVSHGSGVHRAAARVPMQVAAAPPAAHPG
jgi:hypothetical protein